MGQAQRWDSRRRRQPSAGLLTSFPLVGPHSFLISRFSLLTSRISPNRLKGVHPARRCLRTTPPRPASGMRTADGAFRASISLPRVCTTGCSVQGGEQREGRKGREGKGREGKGRERAHLAFGCRWSASSGPLGSVQSVYLVYARSHVAAGPESETRQRFDTGRHQRIHVCTYKQTSPSAEAWHGSDCGGWPWPTQAAPIAVAVS